MCETPQRLVMRTVEDSENFRHRVHNMAMPFTIQVLEKVKA